MPNRRSTINRRLDGNCSFSWGYAPSLRRHGNSAAGKSAAERRSSLGARKELAKELGYTGDSNDSATMNVWLHRQVMVKLVANGGKLPPEIKH